MYCNFLGLRCLPFEDRTDTRFLSLSSNNELLLEALEHEAHQGRGVTPVFGEAGSGKTLLTRALVARLHASDHVVVVTCPRSGTIDLLAEVCRGFGVTISPSEGRSKYTERLRKHLARNAEADHRSILIVDQVEHLTADNLGAVSTLADIHDDNSRLLTIFLFGQPHVRARLNEPQFAPLVQQFSDVQTIVALNSAETKAYIEHRLAIAGSADPTLFDQGAVTLIHAAAKGNPRLINRLCHAALLGAYRADERRVSEKVAASVTTDYLAKARSIPSVIPEGESVDLAEATSASVGFPEEEPSRSLRTEERAAQSPFSLAESTASTQSQSFLDHKDTGVSDRPVDPHVAAMTPELGVMIGRGEALMSALELLLARGEVGSAGSGHGNDLAEDAENRLIALLEKVERTCDRADQAETRLSGFAEKLAEQAEIVQKRIGHLMKNLHDGETLRDEIQKTIQETSSEATATSEGIETQKKALETAMRDARKLRTDLVSEVCDACHTKISDDFQEKRRAHHEMTEKARRQLKEVADELLEQVREGQAHARLTIQSFDDRLVSAEKGERERADSIEKRLAAITQETEDRVRRAVQSLDDRLASAEQGENALTDSIEKRIAKITKEAEDHVRQWKQELVQEQANLKAQLSSLQETRNDLGKQAEDQEGARHASIQAIESRLRAVMSQSAQAVTKTEAATIRHEEVGQHLLADLREKCEQTQADALAGCRKKLQEQLHIQTGRYDETVASTEKKLSEWDQRAASIAERLGESSKQHAEHLKKEAGQLRRTLDQAFGECKQAQLAIAESMRNELEESTNRWRSQKAEWFQEAQQEFDEWLSSVEKTRSETLQSSRAELAELTERISADEARCQHDKALADSLAADTLAAERILAELKKVLGQSSKDIDDQIDRANLTKTDIMDSQRRGEILLRETHTATGQIESLMKNVSRTLMDIGSACERVGQAGEQLQSAEQVTARLTAAIDSGERIDGNLGDTTAKAADLRDAIVRTSAEVETKISQLGSHAAAATHLLGELNEANIEGHRVIGQSAKAIKEARETCESSKLESERLIKDVASLANKTEAAANEMTAGNEHGQQLMKRLGKVIRVASELTSKMTLRTDDAKRSEKTLDEHCTRADALIDRIGDTAQRLEGARLLETDLEKSLDQARAIESELKSTADDATLKQAQLATDNKAACELIEAQDRLAVQTRDSIAQLDQGVADARSTTEASHVLLDQFTKQGKTLHDVLETLGRRATQLEESMDEMTKRPAAIVVDAQAQAAQLEHVCTAVGKIFGELSKASLEADKRTKEFQQAGKAALERLEQLRRETDGASHSLQTWVEATVRVGSSLAQSLGSARSEMHQPPANHTTISASQSMQAARVANLSADEKENSEIDVAQPALKTEPTGGDILKTAEAPRSIENPRALSMARKSTREQEIAGMIADAKTAEAAKP